VTFMAQKRRNRGFKFVTKGHLSPFREDVFIFATFLVVSLDTDDLSKVSKVSNLSNTANHDDQRT
jgi:hypothetical protein